MFKYKSNVKRYENERNIMIKGENGNEMHVIP